MKFIYLNIKMDNKDLVLIKLIQVPSVLIPYMTTSFDM